MSTGPVANSLMEGTGFFFIIISISKWCHIKNRSHALMLLHVGSAILFKQGLFIPTEKDMKYRNAC